MGHNRWAIKVEAGRILESGPLKLLMLSQISVSNSTEVSHNLMTCRYIVQPFLKLHLLIFFEKAFTKPK